LSLQRRLLLYLLACAPLVWGVALLVSADRARIEVNELFDTELIRLARQVQATAGGLRSPAPVQRLTPAPAAQGEADLHDMAIAVWDAQGRTLLVDREGEALPHRADAVGFVDLQLSGAAWRAYYLQSADGRTLVAAGQRMHERDELVRDLVGSQLLPWLLVLPVLLLAMAWAVRQALAPVRTLTADMQRRGADDLQAVPLADTPAELQPLLQAMNGLFARIDTTLARERRFTADAAHELRTPLAVLRAQWNVVEHATDATQRAQAAAKLVAGLDRMDRLVGQLLALSRLEATERPPHPAPVDWQAVVVQVFSDVLPLAERRRIALGCDWPPAPQRPFPLDGDADLLALLLRNLVDNAVRYAPEGSAVTLRFEADGLEVHNAGPALGAEALARLGERFHRADGQAESGSGLGVSIAQRIATLHGLVLQHRSGSDGSGVVAALGRAGALSA
jgi:two-component system sensor histidine kinase QseC